MTQNTQIYTNKHIGKIYNVLIYSKIKFAFICAFCVICVQNYFFPVEILGRKTAKIPSKGRNAQIV